MSIPTETPGDGTRRPYAGKWVAWDIEGKEILASADTPEALHVAVWGLRQDVIYEFIPDHLEPVEGQG